MPTKYQLKNGMKVLLIESHKSPVVAVQTWVRTGSADEKRGHEGISHFIEHLVFKGTKKFGVGEIAQAVERAGGEINAYTTFDQTVFYVTISKEFTDVGLEVVSQMMGSPKFDPKEIDNEREVVIEEIKRSSDNPRQQASQLLFSTVFQKHPYRVPIIGYDDVVRRVSAEDIAKYYQSRYLPQNMNLVIVGDFSTRQMKAKVEKYFGAFKKEKLAVVKRRPEPQQKKSRLTVKEAAFNESFLYISWPTTPASHRDNVALSIFATILGQGDSSRLVHKIRNETQLVNSIGASVFSPKEPGFFAISVGLNGKNLSATLSAIQVEMSKLLTAGPTAEEMSKAVRLLESEKFYSMETVDGLAGLYGYFEFLYDDYKYFSKLMAQTEKLTASEVIKIAKKYIRPEKSSISYLTNDNRVAAEKCLSEWQSKFLTGRKPPIASRLKRKLNDSPARGLHWTPPKKDKVEAAHRQALTGGARMVTKVITSSPVVSLRVGFLGGLRVENAQCPGANELTQRTWATATKNRSEAELNHEIENMASGLGAFGGRNSLGLSMTALAPNFEKTLEILLEVLLSPAIKPDIVEREKALMCEHIKSRQDKPAQMCMLNLLEKMFAGHPYSRDPYGSQDAIQRLKKENLRQHLEQVLTTQNLVVSVVGDVDKNLVKAKFKSALGSIRHQSYLPTINGPPALKQHEHVFVELNKEQTHIALGYRGLKLDSEDRFALEAMQAVLSGQGGRLFVELRDKASLAYTVAPIRMDGLDAGYFGAYIGCSPEKGERAVKMMRQEFEKLMQENILDEELRRAKKYLIGRHDISLQKTGHVADLMLFDELYGLPFNEFETYHERINEVSAKQIRQLAQAVFSTCSVLSVVGKKNISE